MGITDEEREVELTFDQNRIVITKVVTIEEFISEKSAVPLREKAKILE